MRAIHQWVAGWALLAVVLGGGPAQAGATSLVGLDFEPLGFPSAPVPAPPLLFDPSDPATRADELSALTLALAPPTTAEPPLPEPPPPLFVCPVAAPVRFGDTYGESRGGRSHQGVDLTAPSGTPTVAPVAGVVRFDRDSAGGLSWHLTADDGIYYYGTHLSRFGPRAGRVAAGEVIGYVGQTGNASVPHLHFEIRPGGLGSASINPTPFAARHCTRA